MPSHITEAPLADQDVRHLHTILLAAETGATLRWLADYDTGEVSTGVARRVGTYDGVSNHSAPDIRDQYLHISGVRELWLPVRQVVQMLADHTMTVSRP